MLHLNVAQSLVFGSDHLTDRLPKTAEKDKHGRRKVEEVVHLGSMYLCICAHEQDTGQSSAHTNLTCNTHSHT
jgi:hypothetical protein